MLFPRERNEAKGSSSLARGHKARKPVPLGQNGGLLPASLRDVEKLVPSVVSVFASEQQSSDTE